MAALDAADLSQYTPADTLWLWWLADPARPVQIGTLATVRASRGVSLRYASHWLQAGFALSEDLPLRDHEFLPLAKDSAVGAVDDARPDRWGERVIRVLDKPPRLSLMEYLLYAGDERFGALGVSLSAERYLPRRLGPPPALADVTEIERLVQQILQGETVSPAQRRLIAPGVTMGGARPKALLAMEGEPWVVKFSEPGESVDMPLVEHATMTLAARAGITVAETRAVPLARGHAVAVKRFDRTPDGLRRHALSAGTVLKAAGEPMGYPELAQWLRRRGATAQGQHRAQMHELFRRMVFNILMDNTDDHEKNHVLLMQDSGDFELAPAFDVLPSGQALGYQQMRVGTQEADATLENALSGCEQFDLKRPAAEAEIRRVAATVAGWQGHFLAAGVSGHDVASLAAQIDRPFLLDQRAAFR